MEVHFRKRHEFPGYTNGRRAANFSCITADDFGTVESWMRVDVPERNTGGAVNKR